MDGVRQRALWFIGKMPAVLADPIGWPSARAGWLDTYIELMERSDEVDLTVAFPDRTGTMSSRSIGGVHYVGLPMAESSAVMRVARRWRHEVIADETLRSAQNLLEATSPDLVHLHGAEYGYGLAVITRGLPTLLSIQGSPSVIRRIYTRGIDRYLLRSLSVSQFARGTGAIHNHVMLAARANVEARIMASVGHIAGRTDWDRRLSAAMAPQGVYHHLDEPLRAPFYGRRWCREEAIPGRIVSVVGDYACKGVSTLLRAFCELRSQVPDATLVLIGLEAGSEYERAALRHISGIGLQHSVRLTGVVDATALANELLSSSLYVNPSHIENGSNALSEAMLLGVPSVATAAGGMPTTSGYGRGALLVQDGDWKALAGALLLLSEHPSEAERLGHRAHCLASVRHDRERIRRKLLAIYRCMTG